MYEVSGFFDDVIIFCRYFAVIDAVIKNKFFRRSTVNQHNFLDFGLKKLVDPSNES